MASFTCFTMHWSQMPTAIKYQVLAVRCEAYKLAGKVSPITRPIDMRDHFDSRSTFPMILHDGRVVATLRIINYIEGEPREHDYAGSFLNTAVPEKFIEITRVCVSPKYSGLGLTTLLFHEAAQAIVDLAFKSKVFSILGSCTQSLIPLYEKIGCQITDISYSHPDLGNIKHYIFFADCKNLLRGNIGILAYAFVVSKAAHRAKNLHDYNEVSGSLRLALFFNPILLAFFNLRARLRLQKRNRYRRENNRLTQLPGSFQMSSSAPRT